MSRVLRSKNLKVGRWNSTEMNMKRWNGLRKEFGALGLSYLWIQSDGFGLMNLESQDGLCGGFEAFGLFKMELGQLIGFGSLKFGLEGFKSGIRVLECVLLTKLKKINSIIGY